MTFVGTTEAAPAQPDIRLRGIQVPEASRGVRPAPNASRRVRPLDPVEESLLAAAQGGDPDAAHRLGRRCAERGDRWAARHWWERAARVGNVDSAFNLGVWHQRHGTPEEAIGWYEKAAGTGDAEAAVKLAVLLLDRRGDVPAARRWLEMAAENGAAGAARRLALLSEDEGQLTGARHWHTKAALEGDLRSAHDLGVLGYAAGDEAEAGHWWEYAARGGHAEGAYHLGLLMQAMGNDDRAEESYRLAIRARADHPGAACRLGGLTLARRDLSAARTYFELAARTGHVEGQRLTGLVCVEMGERAAAGYWLGLAAAADDPDAAYNLGLLLVSEHGDLMGARHWFRMAAARGHRRAAAELRDVLARSHDCPHGEQPLLYPPAPYWDRPVKPDQSARAELAVLAAGRRGAPAPGEHDLIEIIGTWDLVIRGLPEQADPIRRLAETSGLHTTAIEHLCSVRATLLHPGTAPWPTPAEVAHVLVTARDLRRGLGLR
ncbi:SEL1-like repeat protein [Sphaerimonospora mesophila]|uniref:SEL1-like repeat protein n=1 Tax=Sphaerimonospora mesophila TaxID=37483 RepID=UPI0006E2DC47